MRVWDIENVEAKLNLSFKNDSETALLEILKDNSFLFYDLYSRKSGALPNFTELSFGGKYRCDFAWLNDNSDGPEWVLVEVEKPQLKLFNKKNDPSAELNHAIEQIRSWDRYFDENPSEKNRIFGAVSRFRFVLVGGARDEWHSEQAIKWRAYQNKNFNIEIRSFNTFLDSLNVAKNQYDNLWSFEDNPKSLKPSELQSFWKKYSYMDLWRKILR